MDLEQTFQEFIFKAASQKFLELVMENEAVLQKIAKETMTEQWFEDELKDWLMNSDEAREAFREVVEKHLESLANRIKVV